MITALSGPNTFMLRAEVQRQVHAFIAKHGDMAFEQIDAEEVSYERITEAMQSLPFLSSKKMIVLRAPSMNKQFIEHAEQLLSDIPKTTDIIIVEPKIDKRTAYYKWLKKNTDFQEYAELDSARLAQWTVTFAKEQGGQLSSSDAQYLIARVGLDQQRISNEIDKLVLLNTKITRETIDMLTEPTPQSKIFDLLDAAFAGQTKRALNLYTEQRNMKVEPQEILAMIGWQLRQVALAKTAGNKHDVVREGKMSPYSANKAKAIASRLTLQRLKELVQEIVTIDARSKRQPIDLDEALQTYILNIS